MKSEKEKARKFPQNLVLIGMFGSGKSTIGRLLAEKLRYHFVDVDHLIEAKYRMPLQKVLDKLGTKAFMKMEDEAIQATRASISGRWRSASKPASCVCTDRW